MLHAVCAATRFYRRAGVTITSGGARPAKSVVDEQFEVGATVVREGHEAVNATVVVTDPAAARLRHREP